MTDRLTPEREAEITARAAAATAGPWEVELEQCDCSDGLCSHGTYVSAVYANGERRTEFSDFTDADWQFVIRARTDVPALLAELAAVRAERDQARESLDFLERTTMPDLRRQIQHHQDGKKRWRDRAEEAEARVAELEGQGHLTITDVVAWLSKKAHEYQGNRSNRESAADALARMASKVSRGAIRPTQGGAR